MDAEERERRGLGAAVVGTVAVVELKGNLKSDVN